MISLFLMLSLSVCSLSGHPRAKRSSSYHGAGDEGNADAEELCRTVKSLEQSLKSALVDQEVPLCVDSKPEMECTPASIEILKKCLIGVKVNGKCLHDIYENLAEDKACFCGGIVNFSEMLTSVEALLCADHGRASRLFAPGGDFDFMNLFGTSKSPDNPVPTKSPATTTTTAKPEYHWCYIDEKCGEKTWKDHYPLCGGIRQSPINIDFAGTSATAQHPSGGALTFSGYDQVRVAALSNTVECQDCRAVTDNDLKNNGHTAQLDVTMPGAGVGILSGGPLSENYQILQLHFHWGKDNTKGSEHTYDGAAFPLEMHVVHVKSSLYSNLESALSTTDGLAVTGFQFSIGSENAALKPLTDALSQITTSGGKIPFANTGFQLNTLIDPVVTAAGARYSTYDGGLTTPGCFEVVKWINFKTPLEVSSAQLDQFRTLMDGKGKMIYDNFRTPQPLNGRTVGHFLK